MYHPNVDCWSWQLVPTRPLCRSQHTTQYNTFTDGSPLPSVLWHDSGSSSLYHSSIFKLYQLCQFYFSFLWALVCSTSVPVKFPAVIASLVSETHVLLLHFHWICSFFHFCNQFLYCQISPVVNTCNVIGKPSRLLNSVLFLIKVVPFSHSVFQGIWKLKTLTSIK